jgi:hypothetical protein
MVPQARSEATPKDPQCRDRSVQRGRVRSRRARRMIKWMIHRRLVARLQATCSGPVNAVDCGGLRVGQGCYGVAESLPREWKAVL